ncbi:MAG: sigma-70 family RNA polymerase sigma factor [Candidatus Eremiobacteraeota bacterium]|nr:sigma-70 family RNA polymerase sigma factor [Candidatus Eremiobacteraeota bacterium]MBV8435141.1 sigma-70 family RNA polymerase sigma factor [Candidatus Eremiobacteraeota bacterium]MBV8654972.1 sigma-70 family RNA polymerase sigma factor [Candidatus Eremiobacteraeota bacterium]
MNQRESEIASLLPLVRRIARRIKRLLPGVDLDDLIGDGNVGLVRAVDSFDVRRGPPLQQFARRLIVGAMLNGVRRMDPVSERARRIAREGENLRYAIAADRGDVPSTAEMETRYPGFRRALSVTHWGQPLSLDTSLPAGESLAIDWCGDPASICERRQTEREVAALIDELPVRQRQVVMAHYFGNRSLRSIARALSISSQRTSQLHMTAIARLRARVDVAQG